MLDLLSANELTRIGFADFPTACGQVPAGQASHAGVRPGVEGKVHRVQRELGGGALTVPFVGAKYS